jgi:hypothetical protein
MSKWADEIPMKLSGQEFDKRAQEVFLPEYETVYSAIEVEGTDAKVYATEVDGDDDEDMYPLSALYIFDMSSRPQALDYLLGNRDDFND